MANYSKHEKEILIRFGDKLKENRLANGVSQEKLVELCDLHRTYIGSAERGERNVALLYLNKIAKALDIEVSDLIS